MKESSKINSVNMNEGDCDALTDFSIQDLIKQLENENRFLTKLVDLIPAKMYFDQGIQNKMTAEKHVTMDKAAEGLKKRFSNFSDLSAKNKHKRARLDPLCQKSVSQIHQELDVKKKRRKKKNKGLLVPSATLTRAHNIEELQKRLQEKIELLQVTRKADSNPSKNAKKKLKRLKKQKGNLVKELFEKNPSECNEKLKNNLEAKEKSSSKPVYNKEGKLIYSKFDFAENEIDDSEKRHNSAGKNYKRLLKKAEKKKEAIENLKNTNPEKAELVAEKEKWKKAILKTEGVKIKDDPALLKKSIKKEENKKKKSAKAWRERNDQIEMRMKTHQEKRAKNISARKKDKLDHKIKRAKKKGRVIPGF